MDRPFAELHEIYRIVFLRQEAQIKAEEEKKKKEEADERARLQQTYRPPTGLKQLPYQYNERQQPNSYESAPSIIELDAMEDALEELSEGSI